MTRREKMRAAVLAGPGRFELAQVPVPEPGPGQVRIRVEGCGVCGSNLAPWEGRDWFKYPFAPGTPGHEGWGTIEAVGAGASGARIGERVAFLSGNAFAEYDLAQADQVVPLSPALAGRPFPGEPLGCAVNVFRRSDIQPGQAVAIVGIGFLGAALVQLARSAGAKVIAISRRPFSLEVARRCGAWRALPMDDHTKILDEVRELTSGRLCDRVIEAVGKQWPLDLASDLTRERGRLVIAGYHQDGPRQVNMQQWNWRGLDVINAHERDPRVYVEGIRLAEQWVAEGKLDPFPLLTHSMKLEEIGRAFEAMRQRPEGFLKAVVTA